MSTLTDTADEIGVAREALQEASDALWEQFQEDDKELLEQRNTINRKRHYLEEAYQHARRQLVNDTDKRVREIAGVEDGQ